MSDSLPAAPAPWGDLVLVCRKCSGKLDGRGFGPDQDMTLREAMKQHIRARGLKGVVRAVETDCLDLCPEGRVSVMRIAFPHEIIAVPPATTTDQVFRRLGLGIDDVAAATTGVL
jgi:hypothetical protein